MGGPKSAADCSDRSIDFEQALADEFQSLLDYAASAGWDEVEICSALISLTDHHILQQLANAETCRQIAAAEPSGIVLRPKP